MPTAGQHVPLWSHAAHADRPTLLTSRGPGGVYDEQNPDELVEAWLLSRKRNYFGQCLSHRGSWPSQLSLRHEAERAAAHGGQAIAQLAAAQSLRHGWWRLYWHRGNHHKDTELLIRHELISALISIQRRINQSPVQVHSTPPKQHRNLLERAVGAGSGIEYPKCHCNIKTLFLDGHDISLQINFRIFRIVLQIDGLIPQLWVVWDYHVAYFISLNTIHNNIWNINPINFCRWPRKITTKSPNFRRHRQPGVHRAQRDTGSQSQLPGRLSGAIRKVRTPAIGIVNG